MTTRPHEDTPAVLSRRARYFVDVHGIRLDVPPVEERRRSLLDHGVPAAVVDRMAAYQRHWGGLFLPPAPRYDGGPGVLRADQPEGSAADGWRFDARSPRVSTAYGYLIGPDGEFGLDGYRWAPLHRTVAGWVESLALADHAARHAKRITTFTGDEAAAVPLDGLEPMREVMGVADTWWRGKDSLVAVYTGEAQCMSFPAGRTTVVYSGLDRWDLYGDGPE